MNTTLPEPMWPQTLAQDQDPWKVSLLRELGRWRTAVVHELNRRVSVGPEIDTTDTSDPAVPSLGQISPSHSVHTMVGAQVINTINVPRQYSGYLINKTTVIDFPMHTGLLFLIQPTSGGGWELTTGGNIVRAISPAAGSLLTLHYDGTMWFPEVM